ncbi:hypothetical protein [Halomonas sp. IOP_31]|uniref:hypothetical protein n=1 Tax=Halomonas sp. IOP_31 TaxID=2876584 RepID=UPI001E33D0CA|nr:hypothetical protein [Halomonas sp. IOP_31]MCD6008032.1 hypothetical protein [Halomonas sp. IOP_31]
MDEFEFDAVKSQANLEKHGVDFETAQTLWTEGRIRLISVRRSRRKEVELYES